MTALTRMSYDNLVFFAILLPLLMLAVAGLMALAGRHRPNPNSDDLPPICPRCGGSRRRVLPNGEEWPCPDKTYRHVDDMPPLSR